METETVSEMSNWHGWLPKGTSLATRVIKQKEDVELVQLKELQQLTSQDLMNYWNMCHHSMINDGETYLLETLGTKRITANTLRNICNVWWAIQNHWYKLYAGIGWGSSARTCGLQGITHLEKWATGATRNDRYSRSLYCGFIPTVFKTEQRKSSLIDPCLACSPTLKKNVLYFSEMSGSFPLQLIRYVDTKVTIGSGGLMVIWQEVNTGWASSSTARL